MTGVTFGLNKLQAELEAKNEDLEIPMAARWLGRVPDIKDRSISEKIKALSVTFVVRGQKVATRIIKTCIRAAGRFYKVEAFVEARPDTICGACSGWGHGEHNCSFPTTPRCALCAANHRTEEHKCSVTDCRAGQGAVCIHLIAKCPNCRGPYGARSDQCPKKKEALEKAKDWRGKEAGAPAQHTGGVATQVQTPTQAPIPTQAWAHTTEPGAIMERKEMERGLEAFRAMGTSCGSCQGNLQPGQMCHECGREGVPRASMFACQVLPQTSHKEPCRCTSIPSTGSVTGMLAGTSPPAPPPLAAAPPAALPPAHLDEEEEP